MNSIKSKTFIPVTCIFHPEWWSKNYGFTFEEDFFYNPDVRVETDLKMRKMLYERFGEYSMEEKDPKPRPCIGGVFIAAGYVTSEIMGCNIRYSKGESPEVLPKNISDEEADKIEPVDLEKSDVFKRVVKLVEELKKRFGHVVGDINWQGVLNVSLDLRGQAIFIDMMENPERARRIFNAVLETIKNFAIYIKGETGTSSISVNRSVKYVDSGINLHSNCSIVMISPDIYKKFFLEYDTKLSRALQPYGIHHDGNNMHIHADGYAKVPNVCFFDVGWDSDIALCRKKLPDAFFNLRYDPVRICKVNPEEVKEDVLRMLKESGDPEKTGFCCINMGYGVPDENILTIYKTVEEYRKQFK